MTEVPALLIRDLSFSYGGPPVLEGIDLRVSPGEFLGIVGPNAGGKSTLLKLILGLLKPRSGSLAILGKPPREARRWIGYVPQYPEFSRAFPISVEQVVLQGRLGFRGDGPHRLWSGLRPGLYSGADRRAVRRALERVEAWDLAARRIGQLSGGQLQRILLARALVSEPKLLLLDEPTANIDLRLEGDLFDLLKDLNRHLTILVVSHDIGFISDYVSRVACINRTLVCHRTDAIDGQTIRALYGHAMRRIPHRYGFSPKDE